jgi:hypothetical protein
MATGRASLLSSAAPVIPFEHEARRMDALIPRVIEAVRLDLSDLTVFTEAASGPYLWPPLLAARAGARRVYALARDSRHHRGGDVEAATERLDGAIAVVRDKARLGDADIVTNSASLRPITAADVARMKPTAALPLMWETWEFRPQDLDLEACREHGILVLGTVEDRPPCDMVSYLRPLAARLLFELGLEVQGTSVVLLGRQPMPGRALERYLRELGCEVETFSAPDDGGRSYDELEEHLRRQPCDAVIVAEHVVGDLLLGDGGRASAEALGAAGARVGVIAGAVDAAGLRAAGLLVAPEEVRGPGYMSLDPSALGPRPVLELFAAGLAVGAAATRARLAGLDVAQAAAQAIAGSPAMDFEGALAWRT